jgi:hypothetical protein
VSAQRKNNAEGEFFLHPWLFFPMFAFKRKMRAFDQGQMKPCGMIKKKKKV